MPFFPSLIHYLTAIFFFSNEIALLYVKDWWLVNKIKKRTLTIRFSRSLDFNSLVVELLSIPSNNDPLIKYKKILQKYCQILREYWVNRLWLMGIISVQVILKKLTGNGLETTYGIYQAPYFRFGSTGEWECSHRFWETNLVLVFSKAFFTDHRKEIALRWKSVH